MAVDQSALELAQFLRSAASASFSWNLNNCGLWACQWIKLRRGIDPAEKIRGFPTAEAFQRYLVSQGGVEALVRTLASEAQLEETADPQLGDVGLVQSPSGPMLAIKSSSGWVAKATSGIVGASYELIVAWKV